jgi:DNA end-binding protein Ku
MAARPTWKGFLKISLVNIPIRVFPATDSAATISFNQLHAECQTRIQQKRWCPTCEREVPMSEVAKGYEFEKGRYVVVTEDDMAKVKPESTRIIDLVQFTDAARSIRSTSSARTTWRLTVQWRRRPSPSCGKA